MRWTAMYQCKRRLVVMALAVSGMVAWGAGNAQTQDKWPERPIKLVMPYPAGGNGDTTARLLGAQLSHRLQQTVVVENRPGGGGVIGAGAVAKAAPDGYTLLLDGTAFTVNPSLVPSLPYDAQNDFVPVSQITRVPMLLLVPANSPLRSVEDLVRTAREKPEVLTYASAGNGGAQHLAAELLKQGAQVSLTHVPYRGGAPALSDLAGAQVDLMFSTTSASGSFVKSGRLRALAITSAHRWAGWPDVPTLAESGISGFELYEWNGLFAPAGIPEHVLQRLESEVRTALEHPELRHRLEEMGMQLVGTTSEEFRTFIQSEMARWSEVVRNANIRID